MASRRPPGWGTVRIVLRSARLMSEIAVEAVAHDVPERVDRRQPHAVSQGVGVIGHHVEIDPLAGLGLFDGFEFREFTFDDGHQIPLSLIPEMRSGGAKSRVAWSLRSDPAAGTSFAACDAGEQWSTCRFVPLCDERVHHQAGHARSRSVRGGHRRYRCVA